MAGLDSAGRRRGLAGTRGRPLAHDGERLPTRWVWAYAAVLASALAQVAFSFWSSRPVSALRSPYVDEPFHVALAGELKHHFPAESPWVDGVPLFYHWLVYGHLASASTVTGIEVVVLLRVLSIALLVTLTVLGSAAAANRLTRRWWTGALAAGLLVLAGAPDVFGWKPSEAPFAGRPYSLVLPFLSPTHAFATAILVPLLVLVVEALRSDRLTRGTWLVVALLMLTVAGGKSSTLPPLLAGLLVVTVLQTALRTGWARVPLVLTGTAVAVFLAA